MDQYLKGVLKSWRVAAAVVVAAVKEMAVELWVSTVAVKTQMQRMRNNQVAQARVKVPGM